MNHEQAVRAMLADADAAKLAILPETAEALVRAGWRKPVHQVPASFSQDQQRDG